VHRLILGPCAPFYFMRASRGIFPLLLTVMLGADAGAQDVYAAPRQAMVDTIAELARETGAETGRARFNARVMAAMNRVPRHRFVPADLELQAYANRPLPIGEGQTISQPFIVALMTDLIDVKSGDRVLEIGTGCGYQAAVLGELAREVYTIEIVAPLAKDAAARLAALGYRNVAAKSGDGYHGWPEHAPFDAIIVTAAAPAVPPALIAQLKPGGKLVIPVGAQWSGQSLLVIEKSADGKTTTRNALAVRFVPLTREKP
jgi:protein-L-isoaspartate(D-aspartate) O-methyltransferase